MEGPKELSLISLNAWCGRSMYPLMDFVRRNADTTHIFCFQEVFSTTQKDVDERHTKSYARADLFNELTEALPGFDGSFALHDDNVHRMSLAMFVHRDLPSVGGIGHQVVHVPDQPVETGNRVFSARRIQHTTVALNGRNVLIANYHGLWCDGPKTDTPERLVQAERVRAFMAQHNGPKVLCGDFNLLPDTQSLAIMGQGMRDLVRASRSLGTRTPLYRHYHNPLEPNYADYVLLSPELGVRHFEVMPDIVSDHAPLHVVFR